MRKILICNCKYFRTQLGLTQTQLGLKCGLSQNTISAIESGWYHLSVQNAFKLAEALGIDINELYTYGVSE